VLELFQILKPELITLGINCQVLHDWINLHIPKHEDGNNFGVEVQEEALQELVAVKEESATSLDEQSAYHVARASIMEKITQEGTKYVMCTNVKMVCKCLTFFNNIVCNIIL